MEVDKFMKTYFEGLKFKFEGESLKILYSKKRPLEKVRNKLVEKGYLLNVGYYWTSEQQKCKDLLHASILLESESDFMNGILKAENKKPLP